MEVPKGVVGLGSLFATMARGEAWVRGDGNLEVRPDGGESVVLKKAGGECCCYDPLHPGDNKDCPVHGGEKC